MAEERKRGVSFLLVYALLISVIVPWGSVQRASAEQALPLSDAVTTGNSVVTSGQTVSGGGSGVTTGGAVSSGSGASGVAVSSSVTTALFGVSYDFQIGEDGAPISFSFLTSTRSDIFHQVRIISTASEGFTVSLFDSSKKFLQQESGIQGTQGWRQKLKPKTVYYLVVSGKASAKGSLLLSEIIDDYGDSFTAANAISLNKSYSVETELAGDVDVLAFTTASAEATYTIRFGNISGSGGAYALYDKNGKQVQQYRGTIGSKGTTISPKLAAGTKYYLRLTSEQTGRRILVTVSGVTKRYKVTYQLNGGKNAKGNPTSYISTTKKTAWKKPARAGYVFAGWYLDSRFKSRTYNLYGSFKRNLRLYAKWTRAKAPKTSLKSVKSSKKGQATVTWKKVSGAKGYRVVYGTSKSLKKGVKKKSTTKTAVTLKRLKAGQKYYVMICSYVKDSAGKKVYGSYSGKKKVKVRLKNKVVKKTTAKKMTTKKKTTAKKKTTTTKKKTTAKEKTTTTKKKTTAKKKTTTTKKKTTSKKKKA